MVVTVVIVAAVGLMVLVAGTVVTTGRAPSPRAVIDYGRSLLGGKNGIQLPDLDSARPGSGAGSSGVGAGTSGQYDASGTGTPSADPSTLTVRAAASMSDYDRDLFGSAWTDNVDVAGGHNGCDTRNDILARDLTAEKLDSDGCTVLSGTLADPYTGETIHFTRGRKTSSAVQIDHIVALGNAWVSGANGWPADKRPLIANDPLNLWAVDGPANMGKGAKSADQWLPPNTAFDCQYVKRQVQVKNKYHLSVTPAELKVMNHFAGKC